MADITAQLAVPVIANQQLDDAALGLGLHGQLAGLVLEQRTDQRGQHQRLGQQVADRRGIVMRAQHRVQRRAQPHDPPACVAHRQGKTQQAVAAGLAFRHGCRRAHNWPKVQRSTDFCA